MSGRISRYLQHSRSDRSVLLRLALLLPLADVLIRSLGFRRSLAIAHRCSTWPHSRLAADANTLGEAQRWAELARRVGHRHLWSTRCLPQALALVWMLRRQGLDPCVRIGIARRLSEGPAHAWVELDGIALDPLAASHSTFGDSSVA